MSGATWAACAPSHVENPDGVDGHTTTAIVIGGGTSLQVAGDPDREPADGCGIDQIRESVCGAVADPQQPGSCGPHGDSLRSFGPNVMPITPFNWTANNKLLAPFVLDEEATQKYQATIPPASAHNYCCYHHCTSLQVATSASSVVPPGFMSIPSCIPMPSGTRAPAAAEPRCPAAVSLQGQMRAFTQATDGKCCYSVIVEQPRQEHMHPRGRPLRVGRASESIALAAETRATGDWHAEQGISPEGLSDDVRAALAAFWRAEGQMEHASIAAFAKVSLALLALGAPPDLVRDAHRAAADEVLHAQLAFSIAGTYAGEAVGPAPFEAIARMPVLTPTFRALVEETLLDGCVGEAAAAIEASLAADAAEDPAIKAALRRIAEDEARHAELAFRILAWAVREGGAAAHDELLSSLDALPAAVSVPLCADPSQLALRKHGVLSETERASLKHRVMHEVTIPALRSLLDAPGLSAIAARSVAAYV